MRRIAVALFCLAVLVLCSAPAAAAGKPQLRTQVSSRTVEVGKSFTLQLTALVDMGDPTPTGPTLAVPPGITAHGPAIGMQTQVSIIQGQVIKRIGIGATWELTASRVGHFRIGPPSVQVGGRRYNGDAVTIEVVPARSAPSPPTIDPFDPFSGFPKFPGLPDPFGRDDDDELVDQLPPFPEDLRIARAYDQQAFLHAVVTPARAVVGEQVTLRIYAYGKRGPFRETNTSEPSREDFLAHVLLESSYAEQLHRVPIEGQVWYAKKVREIALFPLRAGQLRIGPMRMGFEGRGYPSEGQHKGLVRYSNALSLDVREPPVDGRPPGYKLGDVGRFTLSATVEPRTVDAGDSVSVVAKLEGTGMVPFDLKTPEQHGVQWLEPTVAEDIGPRGTAIGGWRKFVYVVRLDQTGEIDLGELSLPYWDPQRASYQTARAALGTVRVSAGTGAPVEAPTKDHLEGVMTPRTTLGAAPQPRRLPSDHPWFWLALLAGPASVVVVAQALRAGRGLRSRRAEHKTSPLAEARRALAEARAARARGSDSDGASATERAIFAAIEHATGLKARALLRDELAGEVEKRGVPEDQAATLRELLDDCDRVRFESDDGAARDLIERAEAPIAALLRRPRAASEADR